MKVQITKLTQVPYSIHYISGQEYVMELSNGERFIVYEHELIEEFSDFTTNFSVVGRFWY